ncbi:MAG: PAS domain S-box protein [Candidatus Omnitrophica bacterium]|nr:PAS domain S-box protein [Candidatus Omnitrophota bacterium]
MKLAYKISLFFLFVSFVCLSLALGFVYQSFQRTLVRSISSSFQTIVHSRTKHIETYLDMAKDSVIQASQSVVLPRLLKISPDDPSYKEAQLNGVKLLKAKKESDDSVYEYMLLDASGRIVVASDETDVGQDKSKDAYFWEARRGVYVKDAYFSLTKKLPLMAISVPLFDAKGGTFLGVLVEMLKLDDLNAIMTDRSGLGETGEVFIINKRGYMITPSRFLKNTFLKQKVDTPNARLALEHRDERTLLGINENVFDDYRGVKSLGDHDYIPEMQWLVLARIDASEVFLPLKRIQYSFIWIFLLTGALSWVMGQLIGRMISSPLKKLYEGAQILGRGDLDHKVGLSNKDEVGDLSRAFDSMASNLKKTTSSIAVLDKEISRRQEAEDVLQESEKRFFTVFYSSHDAMLLINANRFVDANEAAARMLGYATREEFLKTHPSELSAPIQPDGRNSFDKAEEMMRLAYEKGYHQFEWLHRKASGEDFPVQVSLTPIMLKGESLLHCVWTDLTRQKQDEQRLYVVQQNLKEQASQLEAALKESQKSREVLASMLEDNNLMRQRVERAAMRVELILSSTSDCILGLDKEGKATFVNLQALKLLGHELSDLIGKDMHSILHHSHPDGSPFALNECMTYQTLQDGQSRFGEEFYWRKNGSIFPAEFSAVALKEEGKTIGVVFTFHDITERKRNEQIMHSRMKLIDYSADRSIQDFLQLALDEVESISESQMGFYHFVNEDEKIISLQSWSTRTKKEFCKAKGESEHCSLDKAGVWADCVHERKPVIHNNYNSLPHRRGMPEGHAVVVREMVVPIIREEKVVAIMGVGNKKDDYTQEDVELVSYLADIAWEQVKKKLIDKEIKERDQRIRGITDSAQDAIIMMDPLGQINFWNPSAERILGYSPAEALGKNFYELLSLSRFENTPLVAYPQFLKNAQGAEVGKTIELEVYRRDGVVIPVALSLSAIKRDDGWHAIGIMRDITERKETEKGLIDAKNAADAANKAKSEFLANMSHEIRTPLNGILGFSYLLRSTNLDEKQKTYLNTVTSSGDLLLSVINEILDFSKLEAGKVQLENIDFDLGNLVYDIFRLALVKSEDFKINSYVDWEDQLPHWVKGDPTRIRQILLNLLNNAVKFTDQGEIGLIISVQQKSEERTVVKFCVKDSGIGIAQDKKDSLFQAFTQVDSSTTRKYGGTGLGLAICKKLVTAMGGEIWIESQEGKGSQFFFTIPFVPGTSLLQQPIEPLSKDKLIGKSILCVDDHLSSLEILSRYCHEAGLRVMGSSSGKQALQKLDDCLTSGHLPDLILSDIMMPLMDGHLLAEKIRSNPKFDKIKIVAVTSDARVGTCSMAQGKGFNAYLSKPVSKDDLLKVICTLLGDQRGASSTIITRHVADEVSLKGLRILVVDDNTSNRNLMEAFLTMWGCVCDSAVDGREAVDKIKANYYNICLMDLQMPVLDGIEATRIIRSQITKELPIIALTAAVMKKDIENAYGVGMNDFLPKPINVNQVKAMLIKYGRS